MINWIDQLRKDPKTISRPSKDEMMKMLYESNQGLEKDYSKELKSLWVTSLLDGSEDYLVSENLYNTVVEKLTEFRHELLKTPMSYLTPPKGMKC